jgi:hypothetical protein
VGSWCGGKVIVMSEEKIPKGVKAFLGYLIVVIIVVLILASVATLPGKLKRTEVDCWGVQFKEDRAFKVNSCNGVAIELDKKSMKPIKEE